MISLYTDYWELNNIEAILFDKDGTIQDDHIYWGKLGECRIKAIIKHFNLDEKYFEELCYKIGYNPNTTRLIKNGPIGTLSRNEVIEFMVDELKNYSVSSDYNEISDIFDKVNKEFLSDITPYVYFISGAKEFLDKLREKNIKMGLVTSDGVENAKKVLKILEIEDYFECVIGKDSCAGLKKTGEPALLALNELKVSADKTIAIGDAPMDSEMADKAKLFGAVLVSTGQVDFEDLSKLSKYCIKNLNEVKIK